jgi:hypothetical protein
MYAEPMHFEFPAKIDERVCNFFVTDASNNHLNKRMRSIKEHGNDD